MTQEIALIISNYNSIKFYLCLLANEHGSVIRQP